MANTAPLMIKVVTKAETEDPESDILLAQMLYGINSVAICDTLVISIEYLVILVCFIETALPFDYQGTILSVVITVTVSGQQLATFLSVILTLTLTDTDTDPDSDTDLLILVTPAEIRYRIDKQDVRGTKYYT